MEARRKGFTLIELLVVMGVISILASIVVPNFFSVREKALISTMTGDLHSLRLAQEVYREREVGGEYATSLNQLDYATSEGVAVAFTAADGTAWSAEATHPGTDVVCTYSTFAGAPPITCGTPAAGKK